MSKKAFISNVIMMGSIWGILEATVGYTLHHIPNFISGSLMFPIGALIIFVEYNAERKRLAILLTGAIAAMLKTVNFFMPIRSSSSVLNPMMAIMVETLVLMVVMPYFLKLDNKVTFRSVLLTMFGCLTSGVLNKSIFFVYSSLKSGTECIVEQFGSIEKIIETIVNVVQNGLLSGAIFFAGICLIRFISSKIDLKSKCLVNPLSASVSAVLAVVLTLYHN